MKIKSHQNHKKKRNILFKSFSDINFQDINERKEVYQKKSSTHFSNTPFSSKRYHLSKGQIPILSKNNKIILITENKFEKSFQKGKSPFFICDKLNFKTAFKLEQFNMNLKRKHLGICDYYSKLRDDKLGNDCDFDRDNSKTPRFSKA